jgi:hypothetical protein
LGKGGGMAVTNPIIRRFGAAPQTAKTWSKIGELLLREKIESCCTTGEPISLFREISCLVLTVLMDSIMGSEFAKKHGKELIPLIQAHDENLYAPEFKFLPWWASKASRTIRYVEDRFNQLVNEEARVRLENVEKYKDNMDFFQLLLNGSEKHDGIIF